MTIPWEQLFELILTLVEQCLAEGRSKEAVKRSIQDPRFLDWVQVRVHIRRETGLWGQQLNEVMDDLRAEHRAAGPRGCQDFADQLIAAVELRGATT